jgi:hypothetical protein
MRKGWEINESFQMGKEMERTIFNLIKYKYNVVQ